MATGKCKIGRREVKITPSLFSHTVLTWREREGEGEGERGGGGGGGGEGEREGERERELVYLHREMFNPSYKPRLKPVRNHFSLNRFRNQPLDVV